MMKTGKVMKIEKIMKKLIIHSFSIQDFFPD